MNFKLRTVVSGRSGKMSFAPDIISPEPVDEF